MVPCHRDRATLRAPVCSMHRSRKGAHDEDPLQKVVAPSLIQRKADSAAIARDAGVFAAEDRPCAASEQAQPRSTSPTVSE